MRLCALEDIADGGARGFDAAAGGFTGCFAVRRGASVFVYVNSCPHIGVPLDWAPDRFLSTDGSRILCSMHGAEFAIDTGLCFAGPCVGERLAAMAAEVRDGVVWLAEG